VKVAILGGSFDPPHIGHLFIAEEARINLGYDHVVFIPAFQPPHKQGPPAANSGQRLEMLALALGGRGDFSLEPFEVNQKGVSYTINTVRHLMESLTLTGKLGMIIGDDLVQGFHTWHDAEELAQMVDIVVARRESIDVPAGIVQYRSIDNSRLPVSSSEIRERVRTGRAFRYLVPEPVYAYIQEHKLYRY